MEIDPDCLLTCSISPCLAVDFLFLFLLEIFDLLRVPRPKYPNKIQENISCENKKKIGSGS